MTDKKNKVEKSFAEVKAEIEKREARRKQQALKQALKDKTTLLKAANTELKKRETYAKEYASYSDAFKEIRKLINNSNLNSMSNEQLKGLVNNIKNKMNKLVEKNNSKNN